MCIRDRFVDCSFTKCELEHTTLNECKFVRCEITGLRSTHSSVQSLDFEDCRLQEIEWAPLLSNGAFPDPIHTMKDCSLKYNTFTEMNFNRFDFSDGNEIVGSMFAKCEMQLANFKGVELHETEFYQCDLCLLYTSPPVCSNRRSISPNRQEPLKPRWAILPRSTPERRKRKPSPC